MEYNFKFSREFIDDLTKSLDDTYHKACKINPQEELPEADLVTEDEFISMMAGD